MIHLGELVARAEVNDHRQKIVGAENLGGVERAAVLGLALGEEAVARHEIEIFVIAAHEVDSIRVRELEPQQGVEHLHPIKPAVSVVSEKDDVKVGVGDLEPVE